MSRKNLLLFLSLAGLSFAVLLAALWFSAAPPPTYAQVKAAYQPSEAWLLDRHGEILSIKRLDSKVRRLQWIDYVEISPAASELLVTAEDRRFYQHGGVDTLALLASTASYVRYAVTGKRPRGASTLSMQLAGFLDPALAPAHRQRSLWQKIKQIIAAYKIEAGWSKQQIIEAYFNLAAFRGEVVGIHAASYALFGTHPSALNRTQSLLLVSLLKGPLAKSTQVANRACALLKITQHENDPACDAVHALAVTALDGNYLRIEQESLATHLAHKLLVQPGARVASTLDASLQRVAMQSLRSHLLSLDGRNVSDGAAVVIDNRSGEVLAYVGSSGSMSQAAEVDGVVALRQAGSTLKPFLYGMAIDSRQLTAASVLEDTPLQLNTPGGLYIPQNYDHDFKGAVSVRTALAASLNVPAVRTISLLGVDSFVRHLRGYGLSSLHEDGSYYGYSLALGGVDLNLLELSNAYRALANQGTWRPLKFKPGEAVSKGTKAISAQAAFVIANILSDRGARALTFGLENPLATRVWSAVKTGTSKDMRDNWCIGFSNRYTVGVWVGNFSGAPMQDVSGISGAAPVWRDLIDYLHAGKKTTPLKPVPGVLSRQIHFSPDIELPRQEWFLSGTESSEIRLVANHEAGISAYAKILYPMSGAIIAMDPDIPFRHQRVQLSSSGAAEGRWLMDGVNIGTGAEAWWAPAPGRHKLVLTDVAGNELDAVSFEVRGAISP